MFLAEDIETAEISATETGHVMVVQDLSPALVERGGSGNE